VLAGWKSKGAAIAAGQGPAHAMREQRSFDSAGFLRGDKCVGSISSLFQEQGEQGASCLG